MEREASREFAWNLLEVEQVSTLKQGRDKNDRDSVQYTEGNTSDSFLTLSLTPLSQGTIQISSSANEMMLIPSFLY